MTDTECTTSTYVSQLPQRRRTTMAMKMAACGFATVAATIAMAGSPAVAAVGTNPQTGCIGGNNMMPAPGMSTQGWATLPDSNPGTGPSVNGMITAMIISDPYWPTMCTSG